jgi:hypothetical protein
MISFRPAAIRRPVFMGQAAAPASTPAVVVNTPAATPTSPLVNMIGWSVVGFASGAAAAYVLGKGMGRKGTDISDSLLGGVGGAVGAFMAKAL